jgi:hypothetical protein
MPLVPRDKRPIVKGWQRFNSAAPTDAEIETWCQAYPTAGIGLAFGPDYLLGVDLDFLDPNKAARAKAMAMEAFGPTPFLRVGRAPKTLSLYRLAPSTTVLGKAFGGFELFTGSGQCVLFGIHPITQRPYEWPKQSPANASPHDVPEVAQSQLDAFQEMMAPLREDTVVIGRKRISNVAQAGVWLREFNSLPDQIAMIDAGTRAIAAAKVGMRHPTMVAVVTALVTRAVPASAFQDAIEAAYFSALDQVELTARRESVAAAIRWAERAVWGGQANMAIPKLQGPW